MKKLVKSLLAVGLSCSFLMLGAACRVKDDVSKDPLTINVKVFKAGFGDEFIYELKQKFDAAFADKGYKLNILRPEYGNAGTPMLQEMLRGYAKTNIDLYITSAITPTQVSKDNEYTKGKELCEDLEELVFNKTAIEYDGTETENKISERIMSDLVPFLRADDGTMYAFTWAQTSAGMVVNSTKLAKYGVTELPRTTNELFEIFDTIKASSASSNTYPVTYALNTGYQNCAIATWLAQYDIDAYNEFLRMQTKGNDGTWTNMTDGAAVFENPNIKEVLEVGFQFMDASYAADGSSTQALDQAQGLVMSDGANQNNVVFMLNGDWFLNEVKANYSSKLANIEFMNVPVISALGTKLFTKYGLNAEKCDELLSYVCKLVDENKTVAQIVADVNANFDGVTNLSEEDAQAVATARGVCYTRGIEHVAFITKDSAKKDIAALALRMMASDDFANTFLRRANGSSPYTQNLTATSQYKFVNEAAALATNIHYRGISSRVAGLRYEVFRADTLLPGVSNLALTLYEKNRNTSYADAATALYNQSIQKAREAWNAYNK